MAFSSSFAILAGLGISDDVSLLFALVASALAVFVIRLAGPHVSIHPRESRQTYPSEQPEAGMQDEVDQISQFANLVSNVCREMADVSASLRVGEAFTPDLSRETAVLERLATLIAAQDQLETTLAEAWSNQTDLASDHREIVARAQALWRKRFSETSTSSPTLDAMPESERVASPRKVEFAGDVKRWFDSPIDKAPELHFEHERWLHSRTDWSLDRPRFLSPTTGMALATPNFGDWAATRSSLGAVTEEPIVLPLGQMFIVVIRVPATAEEDISVSISGRELKIVANPRTVADMAGWSAPRAAYTFERSVELPFSVDARIVRKSFNSGVLVINVDLLGAERQLRPTEWLAQLTG
jgi:HSP20 family molecular chaperone IbpA